MKWKHSESRMLIRSVRASKTWGMFRYDFFFVAHLAGINDWTMTREEIAFDNRAQLEPIGLAMSVAVKLEKKLCSSSLQLDYLRWVFPFRFFFTVNISRTWCQWSAYLHIMVSLDKSSYRCETRIDIVRAWTKYVRVPGEISIDWSSGELDPIEKITELCP